MKALVPTPSRPWLAFEAPTVCSQAERYLVAVRNWRNVWLWERAQGASPAILANTSALIRSGALYYRSLAGKPARLA